MPETKRLVVEAAVQKLFDKNWFDICTLDRLLTVLKSRQGGPAYDLLHALHCVHYDKMDPQLRARIPQLVNECLRQQDDVAGAAGVALDGVVY